MIGLGRGAGTATTTGAKAEAEEVEAEGGEVRARARCSMARVFWVWRGTPTGCERVAAAVLAAAAVPDVLEGGEMVGLLLFGCWCC